MKTLVSRVGRVRVTDGRLMNGKGKRLFQRSESLQRQVEIVPQRLSAAHREKLAVKNVKRVICLIRGRDTAVALPLCAIFRVHHAVLHEARKARPRRGLPRCGEGRPSAGVDCGGGGGSGTRQELPSPARPRAPLIGQPADEKR